MANINTTVVTLNAAGLGSVDAPGDYLFLVSVSNGSVELKFTPAIGGNTEDIQGLTSNFLISRRKRWQRVNIVGITGAVVTLLYGNVNPSSDETLILPNFATITGVVNVITTSSGFGLTNLGPIATGASGVVPQNVNRKRITICCPLTNTGPVYVQPHGLATANQGYCLQPGQSVEFDTTVSVDVRNDTGAAQNAQYIEET